MGQHAPQAIEYPDRNREAEARDIAFQKSAHKTLAPVPALGIESAQPVFPRFIESCLSIQSLF